MVAALGICVKWQNAKSNHVIAFKSAFFSSAFLSSWSFGELGVGEEESGGLSNARHRPSLLFRVSGCSSLVEGVSPFHSHPHPRHRRRTILLLSAPRAQTALSSSLNPSTEMGQTIKEAPCGSWKSPLTAEFVSGSSKKFGGVAVDGEGHLIWLEGRPSESGRLVLMRQGAQPGTLEDITPAGFNVRTVVHEYGGGAFKVQGDTVVFSNYADQRLYKQSLNGDRTPIALTPACANKAVRYADGEFDSQFNRIIIVREDSRQEGVEAVNEIVAVGLNGDANAEPKVLVKGNDFYMFPRLSPDGQHLAWMEWSHPNLPWDRTSIWVGKVSNNGDITNPICVAGGDADVVEAPCEPRWSPQGGLVFVSDRGSGFWNLYLWSGAGKKVQALCPMDAEFTRPAWVFGQSSYSFLDGTDNQMICTYRQRGVSHLAMLDLSTSMLSPIMTRFTDIYGLWTKGNNVYLNAGSAIDTLSLVKVTLAASKLAAEETTVVWSSLGIDVSQFEPYISSPRVIEFPTKVEGETAFANFYPPVNGDFVGQTGELPPLLVRSHGGPTGEAKASLDLAVQYWTSRGWAFADVNYGGSTGYGRAYRERLYGQWGIVDVNDCCSCAEHLVSTGEVDSKRLCIDGRSAGGYTTLAALVFRNTFNAGASLYGLSDLTCFEDETHKFESRYVLTLVGGEDKKKNTT